MPRLVACAQCARLIRPHERACPHCGAVATVGLSSVARTVPALVMGLGLAGCPSDDEGGDVGNDDTMGPSVTGSSGDGGSSGGNSMSSTTASPSTTGNDTTFGPEPAYGVPTTDFPPPTTDTGDTGGDSTGGDTDGTSTGEGDTIESTSFEPLYGAIETETS